MEPDAVAAGVLGVDGLLGYPLDTEAPAAGPTAEAAVDPSAAAEESFVAFYREARDRVARALALTLGDGALGAEAADEAMARAFQRWSRIGGYDDPAGWVYRVGLNWATSVLTRRRRQPAPHAERAAADLGPVAEPAVRAALAELDVRQRAVLVCRFYLGLSEQETATALGTRPGTVKSRQSRGLERLRARLDHLRPGEAP
jgi:RNA polymerase sigma factor (sigma-70 family)